jgi:hypothetical protein
VLLAVEGLLGTDRRTMRPGPDSQIGGCAVKRWWSLPGLIPPGNWFAPSGSNQSSSGGNDPAEASGTESRCSKLLMPRATGGVKAGVCNDLNLVIRGWRNYFSVGNSTKPLKALDHYVWLRIRRSFLARQGNRGDSLRARFPGWLACCGMEHFYKPGICGIGFERSRGTDNR